jgi:hypothetical protein
MELNLPNVHRIIQCVDIEMHASQQLYCRQIGITPLNGPNSEGIFNHVIFFRVKEVN